MPFEVMFEFANFPYIIYGEGSLKVRTRFLTTLFPLKTLEEGCSKNEVHTVPLLFSLSLRKPDATILFGSLPIS